jgi:hypothetical protein
MVDALVHLQIGRKNTVSCLSWLGLLGFLETTMGWVVSLDGSFFHCSTDFGDAILHPLTVVVSPHLVRSGFLGILWRPGRQVSCDYFGHEPR